MRTTAAVPEGYRPVGLIPGDEGTVRVCLLAREEPDAVGGRFVVLSESLAERSLLGCLVDRAGGVVSWVTVTIQDVEGVAGLAGAGMGGLTNSTLEARWVRMVDAFEAGWPGEAVRIGWEREAGPPMMFDPAKWAVRTIMHEASGQDFEVCRDDRVLLEKGLPAFSASAHRYLWVPSLGGGSPFVAVTSDAPAGTMAMDEVLVGVNRGFEPVNAGGGCVRVRAFRPLTLGDASKVVGGGSWPGVAHGTRLLMLESGDVAERASLGGAPAAENLDPDRLFLGRHGRWGRLVETLHLKLRLWAEAVAQVRTLVAKTRRPLFNLSPASFEAEVGGEAVGLPRLWTVGLRLIEPGTAVELPLEAERTTHMLAPMGVGVGIYRPRLSAEASSGRGSLRLRSVSADEHGVVSFEGTLQTTEAPRSGSSDLLMLWLNLAGARTVLYGRVEAGEGLAAGEVRVRGLPIRLAEASRAAMTAAEGVPLENVSFEVLPRVSTPCDLYALAAVAIELLFVQEDMTLAVALDEFHTLAGRLAATGPDEASLEDRIADLFEAEPRWLDVLGPHRLGRERVDIMEAFDLVPPDLWWQVLAAVVRMLPGFAGVSTCRDLGDAPALAPQRVFERAESDLANLLIRTRSLIVIDWRQNREVHAVLRRMRTGLDGKPGAGVESGNSA